MSAEPGSPLAQARQAAHRSFDPKWQDGAMSRSDAYAWLAGQLGMPKHECHIVNFDIATCERVVALCGVPDLSNDFEVV